MSKLNQQQIQEIYIRKKLGETLESLASEFGLDSRQNVHRRLKSYTPTLQYVVYAWYHIFNKYLTDYEGWSNYSKWMIQKIHCSQSKETLVMSDDKDYEAFTEFLPYWHKLYISHQIEEYTKLYYVEEADTYSLQEGERNEFYIYF